MRINKKTIKQDCSIVNDSSVELKAAKVDTSIDLKECLEKFGQPEKLTKDNAWRCPNCKEEVLASKRLELGRMPEILVIQLKRFSFSGYYREKLSALVSYPIEALDMSPYVLDFERDRTDSLIYDLFAVSNHSGGLGGGHYTAVAYNSEAKQWMNYDDSYVSTARLDSILSSENYVLFYKRRVDPSIHAHQSDVIEKTVLSNVINGPDFPINNNNGDASTDDEGQSAESTADFVNRHSSEDEDEGTCDKQD